MIQTKSRIAALALMFLAGAVLTVHAQDDLALVSSQSVNLEGVNNLSISYGSDNVIIRESETNTLTVNEYMSRDKERYYANISRSADSVSIGRGRRPLFSWTWKGRAEIYIPRSFRGNLRIANSSGNLSAEADLLDYQTIDVQVSSGSMSLPRVSAETVSLRGSSGNLDITDIGGKSFVSVSSGRLHIGGLSGGEHRIKVSSGNLDITGVGGKSFVNVSSGRLYIGRLSGGEHQIKLSSGRIQIGEMEGAAAVEVSSGNIDMDIRELSGDLRFDVSSGGIELNMPPGLSFNLDAVTNSSNVRVTENGGEFLKVSGKSTVFRPIGPSPERTIYVRISSGNLVINRR